MTARLATGSAHAGRSRPVPWLQFIFIIVLFMFSNHHWAHTSADRGDVLENRIDAVNQVRPERRAAFILLGLWGVGSFMARRFPRLSEAGITARLAMFFCGWSLLSVMWAVDPGLSAKRLFVFLMFGLGAFAFSARVSPRDVMLLVFVGSAVYLGWGLAAEFSFSTFRPAAEGYRFSGTQIANLQAVNCAFLLISSVVCLDYFKHHKLVFRIGVVAGIAFLLLTRSRSSFAAAIVAVSLYKIVISKPAGRIKMVFVIVFVLSLAFLFLGESAVPFIGRGANLGRTTEGLTTLNGRIWLWMECRGYAGQRKLLGYGFNGFWTPEHVEVISNSQGWALAEAHSVYFDVLLELGLVGVVTYILLLWISLFSSKNLVRTTGDISWGFFFSFLVFYIANGTMESVLIHPGFYSFVSMVIILLLAFPGESVRRNDVSS